MNTVLEKDLYTKFFWPKNQYKNYNIYIQTKNEAFDPRHDNPYSTDIRVVIHDLIAPKLTEIFVSLYNYRTITN